MWKEKNTFKKNIDGKTKKVLTFKWIKLILNKSII